MPTYDYECQSCGFRFEVFQSMSANPLSFCPKCSQPAKRLLGIGSGIIFKGSGFYCTDYRKNSSLKKEDKHSSEKTDKKNENSCACKSN